MHDLEKFYVDSGSYYTGRKKPIILHAILGTCVGVTLCDPDAGVGGLIHLLLPEPVSPESTFQPEKYASSALPCFIEELYGYGASSNGLKACVAGGALVGPLDQRDLVLDIGGKTTDVVKRIFAAEGIRTERSETGGFFSCCLSLDMQTWETVIEPAGYSKLQKDQSISLPTREEIRDSLEKLMPIPQIVLKILRIMDEDSYDIRQLSEEVRSDQVICARTLKLCNSALFARNKIDNLGHALVFLGQTLFLKLILSAALEGLYSLNSMGYSLCKGGIYHHAVGTAVIAEKLAKLTGKANPSLAYTAGLLHDIGKVALDQYVSSAYPLFYRNVIENNQDFLEIEKKVLGIDHTEIGNELARSWGFPEVLINAIRHHHNPEQSNINPELIRIVQIADLLMSRFHCGLELERLDKCSIATMLENIGIPAPLFSEIVDFIPGNVFHP